MFYKLKCIAIIYSSLIFKTVTYDVWVFLNSSIGIVRAVDIVEITDTSLQNIS